MKPFGARSRGLRLERMAASPRWNGGSFHNLHPMLASLRDPTASRPSIGELLLCEGSPRYPAAPLASLDPRAAWSDKDEYDRTAHKLVQLFVDNFAQFEAHVDQGVRDAAPQAA